LPSRETAQTSPCQETARRYATTLRCSSVAGCQDAARAHATDTGAQRIRETGIAKTDAGTASASVVGPHGGGSETQGAPGCAAGREPDNSTRGDGAFAPQWGGQCHSALTACPEYTRPPWGCQYGTPGAPAAGAPGVRTVPVMCKKPPCGRLTPVLIIVYPDAPPRHSRCDLGVTRRRSRRGGCSASAPQPVGCGRSRGQQGCACFARSGGVAAAAASRPGPAAPEGLARGGSRMGWHPGLPPRGASAPVCWSEGMHRPASLSRGRKLCRGTRPRWVYSPVAQ